MATLETLPSAREIFATHARIFDLSEAEQEAGHRIVGWFEAMHGRHDTRHMAVKQALLPGTLVAEGGYTEDSVRMRRGMARALLTTMAQAAPRRYEEWRSSIRRRKSLEMLLQLGNKHIQILYAASRDILPDYIQ